MKKKKRRKKRRLAICFLAVEKRGKGFIFCDVEKMLLRKKQKLKKVRSRWSFQFFSVERVFLPLHVLVSVTPGPSLFVFQDP
jgi:hypothetical protein